MRQRDGKEKKRARGNSSFMRGVLNFPSVTGQCSSANQQRLSLQDHRSDMQERERERERERDTKFGEKLQALAMDVRPVSNGIPRVSSSYSL